MSPTPPLPLSGAVRIGCAGWSVAAQHGHLFGAGESHLARYATRFGVVEINSSFYRLHRAVTYERWAASVPRSFRFSVKLPKEITHDARLYGTGDALSRFIDDVAGLGTKLGGLLVQLPPSLKFDARLAGTFFGMLRRRFEGPIACEPRHPSWFAPSTDPLWRKFAVTRVAADPAPISLAAMPDGLPAGDKWCYWRWHGSPQMYYSAYSDAALDALATQLRDVGRVRAPAWCILDNTAAGHAANDAARLQERLR